MSQGGSCKKEDLVSWEKQITPISGNIWKEPDAYYTQTVIHNNKTAAKYIFQIKDNPLFKNIHISGSTFEISKLTPKKTRGYWLIVDAYSDRDAVHVYSSLFNDKKASTWLKNPKHTQLNMLQGDALGPEDKQKRINRQFVDKAIPEKALLLLSPSSNHSLIWEMHIHLTEKSSLGRLTTNIHQRMADKLTALNVDRLVVWGYANSEYSSDHQYKAFFEDVVTKSNGKIQLKYVKVCQTNQNKVTIPYPKITSCPITEDKLI